MMVEVIPDYNEAPHAITGAEVRQYGPPEYSDVSEAVTAAINDISERQGGTSGITIISDGFTDIVSIVKSLRQLSHDTIFYISDINASKAGVTIATETEMKMWLSDRGNTILLTQMLYCRGWEDNTVIVVDYGYGVDNMCMRAVANLAIVKRKECLPKIKVHFKAHSPTDCNKYGYEDSDSSEADIASLINIYRDIFS